jgi:hypothetical protein
VVTRIGVVCVGVTQGREKKDEDEEQTKRGFSFFGVSLFFFLFLFSLGEHKTRSEKTNFLPYSTQIPSK